MQFENSAAFAAGLDTQDPLKAYREQFYIPVINGKPSLYFCGNSLGLQPKTAEKYIAEELEDWRNYGVEGHFHARHPWFPYHEFLRTPTAKLVGAHPHEVVVMNSLTANLHFLMISFYRPTAKRYKIIFENSPFPSDRYALATQASFHAQRNGEQLFDAKDALIELQTEPGKSTHTTENIIKAIREAGDSLAMVMIGGVNYYTGQVFDMKAITKAAHEVGAIAGFDLAHATGNIQLQLHDWDVDFAAWCSYKYLNSGPGAVAGAFVHDRHASNHNLPRLAGWWGNDPKTRFTMPDQFVPATGADGWQLSNAPVLSMAALRASMDIFDAAGMEALTAKSKKLTGYLDYIVTEINKKFNGRNSITILTPADARGCQLSLVIGNHGKEIHEELVKEGVISDWRHPDVIRVAPVPLYNNFMDVFKFGEYLSAAINKFS